MSPRVSPTARSAPYLAAERCVGNFVRILFVRARRSRRFDPTIAQIWASFSYCPALILQFADCGCVTGQIESNYDETVDSFDDMNLKSELLRGGECFPSSTPSTKRFNHKEKRGKDHV